MQWALSQIVLSQSDDIAQFLPRAHPSHSPPPQSTSVSCASFTPSAQLTPMHLFFEHMVYWLQSRSPTAQPCPAPHIGHPPPPQSTSVSEPFLMWSVQVGMAGVADAPPPAAFLGPASSLRSGRVPAPGSRGRLVVARGAS